MVSADGPSWLENRRLCLSTLRDFGMGRSASEQKIQEELKVMINIIDEKNGKPFDIHEIILRGVCNAIVSMLFGKTYSYTDPKIASYINNFATILKNNTRLNVTLAYLSFLRFLPGDVFKYWETMAAYDVIKKDVLF